MKKLYARLVLWLVTPALCLREEQDSEARARELATLALSTEFADAVNTAVTLALRRQFQPGGELFRSLGERGRGR
jgi:hypothetical protein